MSRGGSLAGHHRRGKWRGVLWIPLALFVAACISILDEPPELRPSTDGFLGLDDFEGSIDRPTSDTLYQGQSNYNGRLVFVNLPRTVVDDVLPPDLHLASNVSATDSDLHPIILLYGDQLLGAYVLWGGVTWPIGANYKELIMLIPFVQHDEGTKWHNYVVRMYLDNQPAVTAGNQHYGYFKELAALADAVLSPTASTLDVTQSALTVFKWTAEAISGGFLPSAIAMGTLDNYRHAIEIMKMPLLGTLTTLFGTSYVCSYWDWNLQNAFVKPIKVTSEFVQPPRTGTTSWVSQGPVMTDEKSAFELAGLVWRMAFPASLCSF